MEIPEEKLVKLYYEKISTEYPKAIYYLDFVNSIILYMYELYYDFNIKKLVNNNNQLTISTEDIYDICIEVLKSINPKYSRFFKKCLFGGLIEYVEGELSWMDTEGLHVSTHKVVSNKIEEILIILHEFAHYNHLIYSGKEDLLGPDSWHISETIAMTFEFYALFYMYNNGILVDEVKKSFLRYIKYVYNRSNDIIAEALMLNIIDKYGDISVPNVLDYAAIHNISDKYLSKISNYNYNRLARFLVNDSNPKFNDKRYYEDYRYIFGFPLSIYIANRMVNSDSYKGRFVENFANIGEIDSDKFLKKMSAYQIIEDHDCLEWVLGNVKSYTNHIINDGEFNTKMIRFKR